MNLYFYFLSFLFLLSAFFQLLSRTIVEGALGKTKNIRIIGLMLILVGGVGFAFDDMAARIAGLLIVLSGIWRLGFPNSSIKYQQTAYPRWVHGILLFLGGVISLLMTMEPVRTFLHLSD